MTSQKDRTEHKGDVTKLHRSDFTEQVLCGDIEPGTWATHVPVCVLALGHDGDHRSAANWSPSARKARFWRRLHPLTFAEHIDEWIRRLQAALSQSTYAVDLAPAEKREALVICQQRIHNLIAHLWATK
jgi:hypothetical protein